MLGPNRHYVLRALCAFWICLVACGVTTAIVVVGTGPATWACGSGVELCVLSDVVEPELWAEACYVVARV